MDSSKIIWNVKKASEIIKIHVEAKKQADLNPFASAAIFASAFSRARIVAQTPQFYDATVKSVGAAVNFNKA